jgi:membrane-bound serine protease (ClpP class)
MLMFLVGLILVLLEMFVFTGTLALGIVGVILMLVSIVMALVDVYPHAPEAPSLPGLPNLPSLRAADYQRALLVLCSAVVGSGLGILALRHLMPRTAVYHDLISESASGMASVELQEHKRAALQGAVGVAISDLRPGGKAQFGEQILDVITQGDLARQGQKVRIIGYSATEAIVEIVG